MSSANPVHRELSPKMSAAFHSATPSGCKLLTKASLPLEVQTEAGAPTEVVVEVTVDGSSFEWTVICTIIADIRVAFFQECQQ